MCQRKITKIIIHTHSEKGYKMRIIRIYQICDVERESDFQSLW